MLDISNYYEQIVIDQLWKMIETGAENISQAFIEDVACLALNKLPNCYVRNAVDKSLHLTDLEYQNMSEKAGQAIAEAIEQVRRNPHNGRSD